MIVMLKDRVCLNEGIELARDSTSEILFQLVYTYCWLTFVFGCCAVLSFRQCHIVTVPVSVWRVGLDDTPFENIR